MLSNKPVSRPGAYFFIKTVAIKCGNIALKIIEPKKPMKIHFVKFDSGLYS